MCLFSLLLRIDLFTPKGKHSHISKSFSRMGYPTDNHLHRLVIKEGLGGVLLKGWVVDVVDRIPAPLEGLKHNPSLYLRPHVKLICQSSAVACCHYRRETADKQKCAKQAYLLSAVVQFAHEHQVPVEDLHLPPHPQLSLFVGLPHAVFEIAA